MQQELARFSFGVEFEVLLPATIGYHDHAAREIARLSGLDVTAGSRTAPTSTTATAWKIVNDGSVRGRGRQGAELVSPILRGENGLEQVRKICEAFAALDITVNRTCGFHVHVGGFRADLDFFKSLVKLYSRYEPVIDTLHPVSRRENVYCRSLRRTVPATLDSLVSLDSVIGHFTGLSVFDYSRRFFKLNLAAFAKHSTVEFRQHAGTVDSDKAAAWIQVCLRMVRAAELGKTGIGAGTTSVARNFEGLPVKTRRVAEFVSRPEGATRSEIINGTDWAALSVNRQARLAGITLRVARERGTDRFFADGVATVATAALPIDLAGFSALIEADESTAAFLRRRASALAQPAQQIAA